jgi:hypothetical protein
VAKSSYSIQWSHTISTHFVLLVNHREIYRMRAQICGFFCFASSPEHRTLQSLLIAMVLNRRNGDPAINPSQPKQT